MNLTAADPTITGTTRFVFREVSTEAELRDVVALRYQAYARTSGVRGFASLDHTTGLDLDGHDLLSHHYGLFARNGSDESVVGTLRITGSEPGPLGREIDAIAAGSPTLRAKLLRPLRDPLPMLSYLAQAPSVRLIYERYAREAERIAEPGRLTVHPALRAAAARNGIRLSHFIVTSALAVGWKRLRLDRVFLDCDVVNEPLYRRFGFETVRGCESVFQPRLGFTMSVFHARACNVPIALQPRVDEIAEQLAAEGEAMLESNLVASRRPRRPRPAPAGDRFPQPALLLGQTAR